MEKLYNYVLLNLYSSLNNNMVVKLRKMRSARLVACMQKYDKCMHNFRPKM
jgi:hypothetical protein